MLRCYLGGALQADIAEKDEETMANLVKQDLEGNNGNHRRTDIL